MGMNSRTGVCLVPGMMLNEGMWRHQLKALEPHFDATVGDLSADSSIQGMAMTVSAQMPGSFHLIAFSLGAIVGMEMWRTARNRILSMIIVGLNPKSDPPERRQTRLAQAARAQSGELGEMMMDTFLPNYLSPTRSTSGMVATEVLEMSRVLGSAVFEQQTTAQLDRPDSTSTLTEIDVPVIVVVGKEDRVTPTEGQRELASRVPNARFVEITDAGHMLTMEQADQFNQEMLSFLKQVDGRFNG